MSYTLSIGGQRADLAALSVGLSDGDTGWFQRSQTDCLRAAVATALNIPYASIPGFRDEVELDVWALASGYRLQRVEQPPVHKRRWIGMSPRYAAYGNARHTLVMAYGALYFDPASGWVFEGGLPPDPTREIEYGLVREPC